MANSIEKDMPIVFIDDDDVKQCFTPRRTGKSIQYARVNVVCKRSLHRRILDREHLGMIHDFN